MPLDFLIEALLLIVHFLMSLGHVKVKQILVFFCVCVCFVYTHANRVNVGIIAALLVGNTLGILVIVDPVATHVY